jgi:hypothetical protein
MNEPVTTPKLPPALGLLSKFAASRPATRIAQHLLLLALSPIRLFSAWFYGNRYHGRAHRRVIDRFFSAALSAS